MDLDSKFLQSLKILNNVTSEKVLSVLFNVSISFLLNPSSYDYEDKLSEIASHIGLPPTQFKTLAHVILLLFNSAIQHGNDLGYLKRICLAADLNENISTLLCQSWSRKADDISNHLLSSIVSKNKLLDLDWSFGVTASSDDCNRIGKTYIQLKLSIEEDNTNINNNNELNSSHTNLNKETNNNIKIIFLELSVEQFYQFLGSLEKCRTFLDLVDPKPSTVKA